MRTLLLILLLACFANGSLLAQRATYQGRIVAREDAGIEPVAGATVILLSVPDSGIVTGVNATEEGEFAFKAAAGKPYILKVVFMGYTPYYQSITPSTPDQMVALGDIQLRADENVAAVQIEARREIFTFTPDGFILNADANLAAQSGTVLDLLRNTPSVRVDADGNVSVRGAGSTQILINGRPSAQAENLEGIPALTVEQIRVVTNPGARYEAEGAGGVIDIRLKRQRSLGFNGLVNAGLGANIGVGRETLLRYNGGMNINFATYKWNFSFGANYMNRLSQSEGNRDRLFNEGRSADYLGAISGLNRGGGYNFRLGVDYIIDSSSSISLEGSSRIMDRNNEEDFITTFYTNGLASDINQRYTGGNFLFGNVEGTLAYQKQFKVKRDLGPMPIQRGNGQNPEGQPQGPGGSPGGGRPGGGPGGGGHGHGGMGGGGGGRPSLGGTAPSHELVAALTVTSLDVTNNRQIDYNYLTMGVIDPTRTGAQRTEGGGDRLFIVGSVDYTHLLSRTSNLGMGLRTNWRQIDSDFLQYDRTATDSDYRLNTLASNTFLYDEQVHAAYLNWQKTAGKFDINAGVRAEYTSITGTQVEQDTSFTRQYINPFPSAQVRYRLTDSDFLRATYGYRIDRPRGWFLNPFVDLNDSLNQRAGNTRLNPTYIHSIELGYQRQKAKLQIGTTLFARVANGVVGMVTSFNGLVAFTRPENLNQSLSTGLEVFVSGQPADWFEFSLTGTGFYYQLSADVLGGETQTQNLNGSLTASTTFTLPGKWRIQVGALYTSPELTLQGERIYFLDFNASVEKRLLKDMLRLSLSCQDIFFTNQQGSFLTQGPYYLENFTTQDSRVLTFSARFMFSNGRNLAPRIRRTYRDNAPNEGGGGM